LLFQWPTHQFSGYGYPPEFENCAVVSDIGDERLFNLLRLYLRRCVCWGGNYRDIKRGIPLGAPLSPLMGALYLLPLDQAMARHKATYVRFMDDWVILSPNRGRLRRGETVHLLFSGSPLWSAPPPHAGRSPRNRSPCR
jgi:hypothetical protein